MHSGINTFGIGYCLAQVMSTLQKIHGLLAMDMIYEDHPSEAISGITHQLQSDIHIRLHKNGNCCHEGKPIKLLKGSVWNDVVLTFRANLPDQLKADESIKFFTSDAEITSTKALQTSLRGGATDTLDIMYVESGALFVWSTRHVGYKFYPTNVASADPGAPIALETLSESPRVFRVSNFLSNDEMEYLKSFATERLERSHVGIGKESFSDDRTSRTAWDTNSETSLKIQRRAFDLIRVKYQPNITDAIQIIRYLPGKHILGIQIILIMATTIWIQHCQAVQTALLQYFAICQTSLKGVSNISLGYLFRACSLTFLNTRCNGLPKITVT